MPAGVSPQDADLFRMLVDQVQDYAIFLLTPTGHVASWNIGAARVKGYTADEIIGHSFERFYTPEDRARRRPASLLARARTEGRVEDEGWRVRKDGSRFWADVVITALFDEDQRLVGFAKVTRDLTDRREQEQERARRMAAERSAERFSHLQMATAALSATTQMTLAAEVLIDVGLGMLGAQAGLVALVSPDRHELDVVCARGYSSSGPPMAGQVVALESAHPLARVYQARRPLFLGSTDQVREEYAELMQMRGEAGPFSAWAIVPLVVEAHAPGVCAFTFCDPQSFETEQRGYLLALTEVAAQAVDRAAAYQAEQQARADAQAAVRAQDEFLSIASHELRTPVAAVKATAQLAQRSIERGQIDQARATRYLDSITRAADRLGALIEDLLDVSRLRTGHLQLRCERLDLVPLVEDVVSRYRAMALTHDIQLQVAGERAIVDADGVRIEQILDNLLSNAVKYSPRGGEIQVCLKPEAVGITISVTDQGIGLPPGQEARVFETFGRASNAAAQQIPGLGLGLAICRQLVDAHGGRISAHSPGEQLGTRVEVWLPVAGQGDQPAV